MPRDFDKDNASSRGRPPGKSGGIAGRPGAGSKPRSGAARGPEKKFAKRGIARTEGGDKRPFVKRERPAGDKPYAGKRDFSDRPKREFSDRPRRESGEAPRPRFNRDDRAPRRDRDDARPAGRAPERKFGERKSSPARDRDDRPRSDRPFKPREDRGERSFKPREDRGERSFKPRGDRPSGDRQFKPRGERLQGDRPFKPREDRGERSFKPREDRGERSFKPRGDRPQVDRPFKPRGDGPSGDRPFKPREDRPRGDRPRKNFNERPEGGERKPWQTREERPRQDRSSGDRSHSDRPRQDRPTFSRPREDRDTAERLRFSRPREARSDRPQGEGRFRPREDRNSWQEHPRSERGVPGERPRRDNEDETKIFAKRPAFGGRGEFRERDREERRPPRPAAPKKDGERIAKLVSRAGLCSRRDAEDWITQGRVSVNGRVINSPALDVTSRDVVTVDGKPLPAPERTRLFLYHKPRGLMTTHADPEGRPTVFDRLPEGLPRLISVGRLDFNTEGLLLLTNDGGLARALELPDTGWLRRYRVRAHGEVTQGQLDQLKNGVEVDGVKYGPIDATLERDQGANVWLVFAIREGKNREVRNVMAHLGLDVNRLIRISYGPFQLGEIEEGQVDEIKTRVLREQLGDKIAAASNANFAVPSSSKGDVADDPPVRKPPGKRGVIADRKGRRVLVQRSGSDESRARNEEEANGYGPPRRPKRGYHGKRDLGPKEE